MITFAEKSLSDFGVSVFRVETDTAPAREHDMISVQGRSGDLFFDRKRYPNQVVSYFVFCVGQNAEQHCSDAKNFLLSQVGYKRLEDMDFTGEYRMACVSDEIAPVITRSRDMFKFQIEFNCKPQRFLESGLDTITLTANGQITNPTLFSSQPLMRVYGAGALGVGSQTITITQADEYTDIDCELMDCFKGLSNRNMYVRFTDYNFPVLSPGITNFSLGEGVTRLEVTPRWWKL